MNVTETETAAEELTDTRDCDCNWCCYRKADAELSLGFDNGGVGTATAEVD